MLKNNLKILVVNNQTEHLQALKTALTGHELEVVTYKPGITFDDKDKDLVVLSGGGGEGLEIDDLYDGKNLWYEDEMNFVLSTKRPILGICMGFEIIAKAYGARVNQMPRLVEGFFPASTTSYGKKHFNKEALSQFEAHRWHVQEVPSKHFEVLAESDTGVEIIRHKNMKILATQFHPEVVGGTLQLPHLLTI